VAGKKTLAITDRQYQLLRVLWQCGPLTVRELLKKLPEGEQQPYTTVLGMLQNMEKAGLVIHDKEVVTYRYRPAVSEQDTNRKLLRDFVNRFFGGSVERLVLGLVDAEELRPEDLRELEASLSQAEKKRRSKAEKR
jgi:predicted transcriptional regulator